MAKLTMTLNDISLAMREAGIPCSPARISAGIASGLYPFGSVIGEGPSGRRSILVYRVDFDAWLQSKIPSARPAEQPRPSGLRFVNSM